MFLNSSFPSVYSLILLSKKGRGGTLNKHFNEFVTLIEAFIPEFMGEQTLACDRIWWAQISNEDKCRGAGILLMISLTLWIDNRMYPTLWNLLTTKDRYNCYSVWGGGTKFCEKKPVSKARLHLMETYLERDLKTASTKNKICEKINWI